MPNSGRKIFIGGLHIDTKNESMIQYFNTRYFDVYKKDVVVSGEIILDCHEKSRCFGFLNFDQ